MSKKTAWKSIALLVGLAAIIVAGRELPLFEWLQGLAAWFRSLGLLGIVLYALLYGVAAMLFLPCMPLTIAAGFIFGSGAGLVAVHTATALGAAGGFFVGRFLGRRHVAERLRRSERFRVIDGLIGREGWKIVGLLRMHAFPFGLSNYLYGMTAISFWHYFLATVIAMLPGNAIFVHLGAVGGRSLSGEETSHPLEWVLLAMGLASFLALGFVLKRMMKKYQSSRLESAAAQPTQAPTAQRSS